MFRPVFADACSEPNVTMSVARTAKRLRLMVLIPTLILSAFGMLMIYSASSYSAELDYGDSL